MQTTRQVRNTSYFLICFIACDLFFSPLIHLGPLSWRLSYILILVLATRFLLTTALRQRSIPRSFVSLSLIASLLIFFSTLGHLIFNISNYSSYGYDSVKSIAHIGFLVLAYIAGKQLQCDNLNVLRRVFFLTLAVNLLFTLGVNYIPGLIYNLYFPAKILNSDLFIRFGITSVEQLRTWHRPLGPHGSPTYSAFAINVIYLFLVVAHLKGYIVTNNLVLRFCILLGPLCLSLLYGSRTELVASLFISFIIFYKWYSLEPRWLFQTQIVSIALIVPLVFHYLVLPQLYVRSGDVTLIDLVRLLDFIENPLSGSSHGEVRALAYFDYAWRRFLASPFVGTGFGELSSGELTSVWYYHNDFLYVLVTSGLLGVLLYAFIIRCYILAIHPMLILPFILPGLTNSFLLCLPMLIAYFFLLGLFAGMNHRATRLVLPTRCGPTRASFA